MKKYDFTGKTVEYCGKTLKQIIRLSDGLVGGYIESIDNLSQYGNAWVSGNAWVYGKAKVSGNAKVSGSAKVYENAKVFGNSQVSGNAWVYGNAQVTGNAQVYGNAQISGNAKVLKRCYNLQLPKHHLTLTDDHIQIGCENHKIEYWEEHIAAIGIKNDYTEDEITSMVTLISSLLDLTK